MHVRKTEQLAANVSWGSGPLSSFQGLRCRSMCCQQLSVVQANAVCRRSQTLSCTSGRTVRYCSQRTDGLKQQSRGSGALADREQHLDHTRADHVRPQVARVRKIAGQAPHQRPDAREVALRGGGRQLAKRQRPLLGRQLALVDLQREAAGGAGELLQAEESSDLSMAEKRLGPALRQSSGLCGQLRCQHRVRQCITAGNARRPCRRGRRALGKASTGTTTG
mmetsp:Transcript_34439/g.91531  ORF Transcript_34439/g.91531 Transcript_34439/m.91531 type:complete len:222 (+) Transcript_34439:1007-1672(+)